MINKKILDILYDDAFSGDALPRYSGFSEEKSDEQFRKKLHNKLATNAMNAQKAANEEAEKINNEWTPKFQKISKFGKIRDVFLIVLGVLIILLGISMGYSEAGFSPVTAEQLGIGLAGLGLCVTSFYSFFSFNDEMFHLILISKTDENQVFANMLAIQTQLSFIRNEIMDLRQFQIKESKGIEDRHVLLKPEK